MSRIKSHEYLYSKIPLSAADNRNERFIIEVPGNWIPEIDIIYYGLLNSSISSKFPKLRDMISVDSHELYLDLCYLEAPDIVRYLLSEDDTLINIPIEDIIKYVEIAIDNYQYLPSNETMLRHAIIEASYEKFIEEIVLVFPWKIRDIDRKYLSLIIPDRVKTKYSLMSGDLLSIIKNSKQSYTSIITNSLDDVTELINNTELYKSSESFILLRNHSGNMKIEKTVNEDGKNIETFKEIGTLEILSKILDMDTGIPTSKIRFARYEPILFQDANPKSNEFLIGR